MRETILIKYLLDSGFLCVDESEHETAFSEDLAKRKEKLKEILDENQMKEVMRYGNDISSHMFIIRDKECFKMLYLGIKLGMEVAEFWNEEYKEWQ